MQLWHLVIDADADRCTALTMCISVLAGCHTDATLLSLHNAIARCHWAEIWSLQIAHGLVAVLITIQCAMHHSMLAVDLGFLLCVSLSQSIVASNCSCLMAGNT